MVPTVDHTNMNKSISISIHISTFRRSISVKRPMDKKHIKITITYTALENTRNTLYKNSLSTII